jgi:hypothetical protein
MAQLVQFITGTDSLTRLATEQAIPLMAAVGGVAGFATQLIKGSRLSSLERDTIRAGELFPAIAVGVLGSVASAFLVPSGR